MNLAYAHFSDGKVQQITNNLVPDASKNEKYTYDDVGRLFTAQRGPDGSEVRKYQYDFDRDGNRWAQAVVAGAGYGGTLDYNAGNNRVVSSGFTYDGSGNQTSTGSLTSLSYSQENALASVGANITYVYDAQGRRIRKSVSGAVTEYFYSGADIIAEKTGPAWTDYIFFGGQRIAKQTGGLATPGAGSATVNGSLQSIPGAGATPGSGSATVNGSLQSIAGTSATAGAGSANITGSEQSTQVLEQVGEECVMWEIEGGCIEWQPVYEWVTYWDDGTVSVTVNGFTKNVWYGQGSTGASVATALANAFNADGASPVTASAGGTVVYLTSKATGTASNYPLSATSWTNDPAHFSGPSFVPVRSGPTLTGGADATPTTYDSGAVWVT